MRKLAALLGAVLFAPMAFAGGDFLFSWTDAQGNPQALRKVYLYPDSQTRNAITAAGLGTIDRISTGTATNGSVVVSNLFGGRYRAEFVGTYTITTNWFSVPDTNGFQYATNFVLNPTIYNGIPVYSAATTDAKIAAAVAGATLSGPTNGVTSAQVASQIASSNLVANGQSGVTLRSLTLPSTNGTDNAFKVIGSDRGGGENYEVSIGDYGAAGNPGITLNTWMNINAAHHEAQASEPISVLRTDSDVPGAITILGSWWPLSVYPTLNQSDGASLTNANYPRGWPILQVDVRDFATGTKPVLTLANLYGSATAPTLALDAMGQKQGQTTNSLVTRWGLTPLADSLQIGNGTPLVIINTNGTLAGNGSGLTNLAAGNITAPPWTTPAQVATQIGSSNLATVASLNSVSNALSAAIGSGGSGTNFQAITATNLSANALYLPLTNKLAIGTDGDGKAIDNSSAISNRFLGLHATADYAFKADVKSTEAQSLVGVDGDRNFTLTSLTPSLINAQFGTAALTNLAGGDGSGLTGLNASSVTGTLTNNTTGNSAGATNLYGVAQWANTATNARVAQLVSNPADSLLGVDSTYHFTTVSLTFDLLTGTLPLAKIPAGGDSTTYLRGDGIWATPAGGPGGGIATLNGLGTNLALVRPWIDVRAFGAKGDGATDDSTAFARAIQSATWSNCPVLVSPGDYFLPTNLTVSCAMLGFGTNSHLFPGPATGTFLNVTVGGKRIQNLWIDGTNSTDFSTASPTTGSRIGLTFFSDGGGDVSGNLISGFDLAGLNVGGTSTSVPDVCAAAYQDNFIRNCYKGITNGAGYGEYGIIRHNRITHCWRCIDVYSANVVVCENILTDFYHGILLGADAIGRGHNKLLNNTLNHGDGTLGVALEITNAQTGVVVSGNSFYTTGTIQVKGSKGVNIFGNIGGGQLWVDSGVTPSSTGILFHDNVGMGGAVDYTSGQLIHWNNYGLDGALKDGTGNPWYAPGGYGETSSGMVNFVNATNSTGTAVKGQLPVQVNGVTYYIDLKQ